MPSVNKTLGARFKIEGEEEYKNVISQLNAGSRTLASEMTRLNAQYKGNTDSIEYLKDKSELLNRTLEQQRQKTEATRKMHEAASKAYADAVKAAAEAEGQSKEARDQANASLAAADRELQKYATALNLAEAREFDLQHQIEETNNAANGQKETFVGLGDTVEDLAGKLGIRIPTGATKALNGMSSLSAGTVAAMGAAVAAVAALIKTTQQLQQTTIEAAARADDILTKSTNMGISASQYQAFQFASPFVDVDVDTMAASLAKLTQAMADAQAGGESTSAMFRNLGVQVTDADGHLRNSYDVWLDVMDALSNMGNATEQDAAAMELLGKKAQDFAPIYREGTEALREYTEAAQENYVMSDEQLEALGRVDDAVQKLHLTEEANKNMIAAEWAPTAEKVLTTMERLFSAAGKALEQSGIIRGFGELVQLGTMLLEPIAELFEQADDAPNHLGVFGQALHGLAVTIAAVADAANWLIGLLQTLSIVGAKSGLQRMGTSMGYGASSGNYSFSQRVNGVADAWEDWRNSSASGYAGSANVGYDSKSGRYYDLTTGNYLYSHNATGNDNWRGGLTWAGEAGPELVQLPAGSRIYSAQESRQLAGGDTFYITIDAKNVKEFNDIVNLAKSAQVRSRMRG